MITRGLAGSVLVLLGGLVVSVLPRTAPVLDNGTLELLRGTTVGRMAGLTVVMVGLGLLAAAWLSLCRHVATARGPAGDDALALVRHAVVVWSAPLLLAPPLFSRDGWSYAAQGMMAHLGISPYEWGPWVLRGPVMLAVDPMWLRTTTPYGPLPVGYGELVAAQTGNPWMLVVAHRVLALVGLVLLAYAVPRLARWTGVNPALASCLALASPLMIAHGVGGLHNDLLMVGLMALALVVAAKRPQWWVWGAILGGLAAAVKVPGGLVCIGVVLVTLPVGAGLALRVRRYLQVGAVAVGTLVVLGLVSGLGIGWVHALGVPGKVNTPLSLTSLTGGVLDWIALHLGTGLAPATFLDLVRGLGTVLAMAVAVRVALTYETGRRDRALAAVATVVGVLVLLSPVVHLWYLLWVVPLLAAMRLPRYAMFGLVAASVLAGIVAPLDSSLHGAYYAIVLGTMIAGVLATILLLTPRARARVVRIVEHVADRAVVR